jgi:transglutaminase-like putative cysteine protease
VYLKDYGWYRIDARGNKAGVDAQFTPPHEKLAFELGEMSVIYPICMLNRWMLSSKRSKLVKIMARWSGIFRI